MPGTMSASTRTDARGAERARKAAQDQREARLRRVVAWGGGLLIVLLLAAILAAVVSSMSVDDEAPQATGAIVAPASTTADGGVPIGPADAPVTVTVFFDYMCPFCGRFETANATDLDRLVDSGEARVELRPLSFLDPQSQGSEFSTRAANALATVADGAPEQAWAFHRGLFEEQPEEGTSGLGDDVIARIARDTGVPDEVAERFGERTFTGWVAQGTERAFASGVTGTPTVLIDGEVFGGDLYTAGPLAEAVRNAADR
jgi:protein-disulfide isomerase